VGKVNWTKLIISVGLCLGAGLVGSVFTLSAIPSWYTGLVKPDINPPSGIFGPVWTLLYIMMGLSLYLVWNKGYKNKRIKQAVKLFILQLVFNLGWVIIFFGLRQIFLSFVEIIILWGLLFIVLAKFSEIDRRALYLLIPYHLWITFATFLNFSVWTLNK